MRVLQEHKQHGDALTVQLQTLVEEVCDRCATCTLLCAHPAPAQAGVTTHPRASLLLRAQMNTLRKQECESRIGKEVLATELEEAWRKLAEAEAEAAQSTARLEEERAARQKFEREMRADMVKIRCLNKEAKQQHEAELEKVQPPLSLVLVMCG